MLYSEDMTDLIIIGGGPAGIAAGVYAARKRVKTALITEEIGGQSTVSEGIENWIGTVNIPGSELAKSLRSHLDAYKGDVVRVLEGERVTKLEKVATGFKATTSNGTEIEARSVLIASGAGRRKLAVPGADTFEHKGVTYCASCDGPMFSGKDVAVVGGGNAGLETAAQLLAYARSVTLIHRRSEFKADAITVEKVLGHDKLIAMTDTEPVEVHGDKFVTGMTVKNVKTGETTLLPVTGVFVEVGVLPNTDFAKGLVALDEVQRVIANPRNQRAYQIQTPDGASGARRGESAEGGVLTSTVTEAQGPHNNADEVPGGVWAAGDCTDELYHQNNIAAGDGVKALEDIYQWLARQS